MWMLPAQGRLFADGHTRLEISNLNLPESLSSFFRLKEQDGFVVVFSFPRRSPELEVWLRELCGLFTRQLGIPVFIQYGPRCYEQYAYLCRPGPLPAMYLVLRADYLVGTRIPGATFTFSQLHKALVLGESESMGKTTRPVLRLNLTGEIRESMDNLKHLFELALPKLQ